jgi:hypothetical protein
VSRKLHHFLKIHCIVCRRACALDYPQLSAIAQPWAINRRTGLPCEHGGVGASFAAATRLRRWGMSSSDAFPRARRNPDADPAELEWAGYVVEQAVGASLGLIGPDVLGLAVEVRKDGVIFHVALFRRSKRADDDIEDMVFEFDALTAGDMEGGIPWSVAITVGGLSPRWDGGQLRPISLAHESVRIAVESTDS